MVREVRAKPDEDRAIAELASLPKVHFASDDPVPGTIERWDLGPGESQVLTVAASQAGARAQEVHEAP